MQAAPCNLLCTSLPSLSRALGLSSDSLRAPLFTSWALWFLTHLTYTALPCWSLPLFPQSLSSLRCCFLNTCDSDEPGLALFSHALCPLEEPSCALLTQTKFNFFFSERKHLNNLVYFALQIQTFPSFTPSLFSLSQAQLCSENCSGIAGCFLSSPKTSSHPYLHSM